MLRKKELVVYLTIAFSVITGIFIFVPAVAVQKPDVRNSALSSRAEGINNDDPSVEDGGTDIQDIMKALEKRERELSKREVGLKKEEERLNMLRSSVELSLKQYTSLRDRMQKGNSDNKPMDGVSHMAKLYESMSVEEAARRIEIMDTDLAVKLLTAIKSKQAGKILGTITPDKAALISSRIASKKVVR